MKTPQSEFESQVHSLFAEGQQHLHHEEFALAHDKFRELQLLVLNTVHPKMPVEWYWDRDFFAPLDVTLIPVLAGRAGEMLRQTPDLELAFPSGLTSPVSALPAAVQERLKPFADSGLQTTSYHADVGRNIELAMDDVRVGNWPSALKSYSAALEKVPEADSAARASLLHDMALLSDKAGDRNGAVKFGTQSLDLLANSKRADMRVIALDTMSGVYTRAGKADQAAKAIETAASLRAQNNLSPITRLDRGGLEIGRSISLDVDRALPGLERRRLNDRLNRLEPGGLAAADAVSTVEAGSLLMGTRFLDVAASEKRYVVRGMQASVTIPLKGDPTVNVTKFLENFSATPDLKVATGFFETPVQMVAYLPHMYFFVIPMALGDCLAGLGNLEQAEQQYRATLPYPYINRRYEIPKLWARLADLYLALGDQEYRRARDTVAQFSRAKVHYEKLVRANNTLDAASPLYADAKFAAVRTRVQTALAAANPLAVSDDPALLIKVLNARSKLTQIQAGLNFFGFSPDYAPPFSFEYLQNTARYFAQQAAQIEQRYIQFKSTAENEELRREQLDQQAEVARQSVILEQRGVAEAQAGINVAQASVNYTETQRAGAVAARDEFNAVRWELLDLSTLEAWANAASVGPDDEIKMNIDWDVYHASGRRRSWVIQDLARRRTRISHDLEASKLQRAGASAEAYKTFAQAQVAQAQARKAVAEQRVVIAQLQQKYAEENRDFLDMREFSSRLWYELAAQARQISQRYLDMATTAAFLMERAYNAETERGLRVIRYDYSRTPAGNLMGADFLLADIDSFTLDHIATVRTKKIPVKKTLSLADSFPIAFQRLKTQGRCFFQTELADFDREYPGLYLCKLRNVEVLLVGITGALSVAGTLRNVGVSRFRLEGGAVASRLYPADVMPLSQYNIRQDALVFRFNPNELRLFENNGIDTLWQLELPPGANEFDADDLLDIHLVLYYDGFFSPALETNVRAALPASGMGSRAFSMRMTFPDELFYLKNQGQAELAFDEFLFPRSQKNLRRIDVVLKLSGPAAAGLTLRLTAANHAGELVLKTNADGEVNDATAGQPLRALHNEPLPDRWTIRVTAADNPALVRDGALDLSGLRDVQVFFEYRFDYR